MQNEKEIIILPSTLETIDYAMHNWLKDKMDIFSTTNKGWKKVPVMWVSAERAHHIKNNKGIRDEKGSIILPIISLERTSVQKDLSDKGSIFGAIPEVDDARGGTINITRRIQQDKTANFANADSFRKNKQNNFPRKNTKIVYQNISIPIPIFINVTYDIYVKAEYQQQLNEILTPFITRTGGVNHFLINHDGHQYESFIQQDFSFENNVSNMGEEERKYESLVQIRVLGYLIGDEKNQEQPKIVIRENAVQVRLGRERVIMGDIPEHIDKNGFYRE